MANLVVFSVVYAARRASSSATSCSTPVFLHGTSDFFIFLLLRSFVRQAGAESSKDEPSREGKAAMASVVTERLLLREWDLGRDLGPFGAICRDADVMRYIDDG